MSINFFNYFFETKVIDRQPFSNNLYYIIQGANTFLDLMLAHVGMDYLHYPIGEEVKNAL